MHYRHLLRLTLLLLIAVGWPLLLGAAGCDPKKWKTTDILGSGKVRSGDRPLLLARWRRGVNPNYRYKPLTWKLSPEESSSPVIDELFNMVCVGSERQLVSCLHLKTGKHIWSFKTQGRVLAPPLINDRVLYVGTTSGVFYALETIRDKKRDDRLKVKVKWKFASDGEILSQAAFLPATDKKPALVLFTSSNNKITALRAKTGTFEWQQRSDPPDRLSIRGQASPVIFDDAVYTGYSDGTVMAYNAHTGKELWKRSIKENDRFPDVDGAPTVNDTRVYVASYSGSVVCLKRQTGKPLWKYKMRGVSRVELRDADIFLSSHDGWVAAINAENGKQRWKKRFRKAGAFTDPVTDNQNLYVASSQNGIYVLRPDDGKLLQRVNFRVGFARPRIHSRSMFVLAYNSLLYSFKIFDRPSAF